MDCLSAFAWASDAQLGAPGLWLGVLLSLVVPILAGFWGFVLLAWAFVLLVVDLWEKLPRFLKILATIWNWVLQVLGLLKPEFDPSPNAPANLAARQRVRQRIKVHTKTGVMLRVIPGGKEKAMAVLVALARAFGMQVPKISIEQDHFSKLDELCLLFEKDDTTGVRQAFDFNLVDCLQHVREHFIDHGDHHAAWSRAGITQMDEADRKSLDTIVRVGLSKGFTAVINVAVRCRDFGARLAWSSSPMLVWA